MIETNPCGCGASETEETCTCPAGVDGSTTRFGDGLPTIISTDKAGDVYIQRDSTPAGEMWSFSGAGWVDEGFAMQGDPGATGASGSAVIYNSLIASPAGVAFSGALADVFTFQMPANSLKSDGDYIDIDFFLNISTTDSSDQVKIDVESVSTTIILGADVNTYGAKGKLRVFRIDATTIQIWRDATSLGFFNIMGYGISDFQNSSQAVSDLSANIIPIKLKCAGTGTARFFTVTLYNF